MRRRLLAGLAWGLVLVWAVSAALPDGALGRWWRARATLAAHEARLATLAAREAELGREIHALRHDHVAIEAAIHRELGYVHPDELIVLRK